MENIIQQKTTNTMLRFLFLFILVISFFPQLISQQCEWEWGEHIYVESTGKLVYPEKIGFNADGESIYFLGLTYNPLSVGDTLITHNGNAQRYFSANFKKNGEFISATNEKIGSQHVGLTIDDFGKIHSGGTRVTNVPFLNDSLNLDYYDGYYYTRFDENWNLIASQGIPCEFCSAYSNLLIEVDSEGNYYLMIHTQLTTSNIEFPDTTVSLTGSKRVFIAKYNINDEYQWVKVLELPFSFTEPIQMKTDSEDNLILAGTYDTYLKINNDSINLDPILTNEHQPFVAKINSLGEYDWVKVFGNGGQNTCNDLAIGEDDKIYITGTFWGGDYDIDGNVFSVLSWDPYFAKLDQDGNIEMLVVEPVHENFQFAAGRTIAVDNVGNIIMGGQYEKPFNLDAVIGNEILSADGGGYNIFTAVYDNTGNLYCVNSAVGEWTDRITDMVVDNDGNVFTVGSFQKGLDFGSFEFQKVNDQSVTNEYDTYLTKFNYDLNSSVEQTEEIEFKVYPNPSDGSFIVEIAELENSFSELEIYNANGSLINTQIVAEGKNEFNGSSFSNGIYFLKLVEKDKVIIKKIIINKD